MVRDSDLRVPDAVFMGTSCVHPSGLARSAGDVWQGPAPTDRNGPCLAPRRSLGFTTVQQGAAGPALVLLPAQCCWPVLLNYLRNSGLTLRTGETNGLRRPVALSTARDQGRSCDPGEVPARASCTGHSRRPERDWCTGRDRRARGP